MKLGNLQLIQIANKKNKEKAKIKRPVVRKVHSGYKANCSGR